MSEEPTRSGMGRRGFLAGMGAAAGSLIRPTSSQATQAGRTTPGSKMRALLSSAVPLMCPGGYDVLSARLIQESGFEAMVVGGSASAASMHGLPDYGLVSITELIDTAAPQAR